MDCESDKNLLEIMKKVPDEEKNATETSKSAETLGQQNSARPTCILSNISCQQKIATESCKSSEPSGEQKSKANISSGILHPQKSEIEKYQSVETLDQQESTTETHKSFKILPPTSSETETYESPATLAEQENKITLQTFENSDELGTDSHSSTPKVKFLVTSDSKDSSAGIDEDAAQSTMDSQSFATDTQLVTDEDAAQLAIASPSFATDLQKKDADTSATELRSIQVDVVHSRQVSQEALERRHKKRSTSSFQQKGNASKSQSLVNSKAKPIPKKVEKSNCCNCCIIL